MIAPCALHLQFLHCFSLAIYFLGDWECLLSYGILQYPQLKDTTDIYIYSSGDVIPGEEFYSGSFEKTELLPMRPLLFPSSHYLSRTHESLFPHLGRPKEEAMTAPGRFRCPVHRAKD
ncbi:conserved hypothetical protein [Ricinus communis]|uniref:Uncharacterized protein n=1 Tax=Ricinus communis TaxID=3988 RepID=B9SLQ9_RICCO|nr:conserved hypothetical protein [Ricinus communis]